MGQADRRGGLIDVLPTGAAGTEQVFAVFVGCDRNLHILRLREDGDSRRGGVDPPLGFRIGNPLHAMSAALVLQAPVDRFTGDAQHHLLETAQLRAAGIEHLHIPALLRAVAAIHLIEIAHKQRRLVAAGAGTQLHDAAGAVGIFVVGAEIKQGIPLLLALLLECRQLCQGHGLQFGIVVPGHLAELGNLPLHRHKGPIPQRQLGQRPVFPSHRCHPRCLGLHVGIGHLPFKFLESGELGLELFAHGSSRWGNRRLAGGAGGFAWGAKPLMSGIRPSQARRLPVRSAPLRRPPSCPFSGSHSRHWQTST